jgi:hypothetical protein
VATSVALVAAAGGGVAAVLAECWRCGVVTPAVVAVRLPAHRDRPTLQREVASPSVSRSWSEGERRLLWSECPPW